MRQNAIQSQPPPTPQVSVAGGAGRPAGVSAQKCANCGLVGHLYKQCNQPVTSFGVVLCWRARGSPENRFLVVQRRDSYSYVEFIRGKYDLGNREYAVHLFSSMTEAERSAISRYTFCQLWDNLWNGCRFPTGDATAAGGERAATGGGERAATAGGSDGDEQQSAARLPVSRYGNRMEFFDARAKFLRLREGVAMKTRGGLGATILFDLDYLVSAGRAADYGYVVPEWGFPKGRRNMSGESGLECALRELREETGIHQSDLEVVKGKPFEEVFTGSNGVRYRHVYYMARLRSECDSPPRVRLCQRELRAAGFADRDTIISLFCGAKERQELFKRLAKTVSEEDEARSHKKNKGPEKEK